MFPKTAANKKLAERIFLKDLEESRYFPKYFEIETVNACNARCSMCSVRQWKKAKSPLMSDKLFNKFVNEISKYADWIETVCLNRDGEPMLDKNIALKVREVKACGIKNVTFATNAQLLTPEAVHKLIDAGLDDIMISIDSLTKKTFELIRKGLDYEKVLKNTLKLIDIRNKKHSKMTIRIRMVVMEENQSEVKEWMRFWKSKVCKHDRVYAMPKHTWGNQIENEKNKDIAKYSKVPCVSLFSTLILKSDGRVPLCGADYNARHIMGNFGKQSVEEIWNGKKFTNLRHAHAAKNRNSIDMCCGCHIWDKKT